VGGSTAGRLLACPASWQLTRTLPPSSDVASPYAEEGTFVHEVMATLLEYVGTDLIDPRALGLIAQRLIGTRIYDRELTRDHLDTLVPALDCLSAP
jgi:hypothetical protein